LCGSFWRGRWHPPDQLSPVVQAGTLAVFVIVGTLVPSGWQIIQITVLAVIAVEIFLAAFNGKFSGIYRNDNSGLAACIDVMQQDKPIHWCRLNRQPLQSCLSSLPHSVHVL